MKYSEMLALIESENLDELSQETLKKYTKTADFSARLNAGIAEVTPEKEKKQKYIDKAKHRIDGIKRAASRLKEDEDEAFLEDLSFDELIEYIQTEEYAQLDELSKQTLASYIKDAPRSMNSLERSKHNPAADKNAIDSKIDRRRAGLNAAISKIITKEEEQIDEISSDAIERYVKKSFKSYEDNSDVVRNSIKAGKVNDPEAKKSMDTASKRLKGLATAHRAQGKKIFGDDYTKESEEFDLDDLVEFIQTEEYMQLDELSKRTLGSYIKKASSQEFKRGYDSNSTDNTKFLKGLHKSEKRMDGIRQAVNKLSK